MIEAIDLTVRRRGRIVLDAVSFDVRPGQVTGVLGGTGAGKSALLRRMVELERGGGKTLFDGRPYRSLPHPMREVGLLLEPGVGHPQRTVRGHLGLALATDRRAAREGNEAAFRQSPRRTTRRVERTGFGTSDESIGAPSWHGLPERGLPGGAGSARSWRKLTGGRASSHGGSPAERIDAVLDIVGLTDQAETRLADLTDGMATRFGIAVALLGDPKALLFDAPDRGLEPEGVAWLGALLRAFTGQGRAALVTGSDTETLVGLADRLLLLDSGYLVGTRTAEEVLRAPTGASVIVRSPQIVRFAAILAESGARSAQGDGACLEVRGLDRARVGDLAYRHGIPVHELSERFTGTDPGDVVLAACSGRSRPIVPFQGFPETASEISGILANIVAVPLAESEVGLATSSASASGPAATSWAELWSEGSSAEGLSAMESSEALSLGAEAGRSVADGELHATADVRAGGALAADLPDGVPDESPVGSSPSPIGSAVGAGVPSSSASGSAAGGDASGTQASEVGR